MGGSGAGRQQTLTRPRARVFDNPPSCLGSSSSCLCCLCSPRCAVPAVDQPDQPASRGALVLLLVPVVCVLKRSLVCCHGSAGGEAQRSGAGAQGGQPVAGESAEPARGARPAAAGGGAADLRLQQAARPVAGRRRQWWTRGHARGVLLVGDRPLCALPIPVPVPGRFAHTLAAQPIPACDQPALKSTTETSPYVRLSLSRACLRARSLEILTGLAFV